MIPNVDETVVQLGQGDDTWSAALGHDRLALEDGVLVRERGVARGDRQRVFPMSAHHVV